MALVENNPGKEYSPVTSRAEPGDSFFSAFPSTMRKEGKENIGTAMLVFSSVNPPIRLIRTVCTGHVHVLRQCWDELCVITAQARSGLES